MGRVSHAKALVHEHGFELMERSRKSECYRRSGQFLVRYTPVGVDDTSGPDAWTAIRGPSSARPDWLSPVFGDAMTCLIAAELDNWGQ